MSDSHLDRETLARLVDGDKSGMDEAAWRHLASCRFCFSAFSEAVETKQQWLEKPGSFSPPEELLALARSIPAGSDERSEDGTAEPPGSFFRLNVLRLRTMQFAGLALAASLILALLLPPRPAHVLVTQRGGDDPRFTRPVEGEVVTPGHRTLSWTAIPDASSYTVSLRDLKGEVVWEGSSPEARIKLPEDLSLSQGASYKALLSVQPADLLPPGRTSVAFQADSYAKVAWHRLRWAKYWIQVSGIAGFALLVLLGFHRSTRH